MSGIEDIPPLQVAMHREVRFEGFKGAISATAADPERCPDSDSGAATAWTTRCFEQGGGRDEFDHRGDRFAGIAWSRSDRACEAAGVRGGITVVEPN